MKKYRVTVSGQTWYTIDVEATSPAEAEEIVYQRLCNDDEDTFRNSLNATDDDWYVCEGEAFELEGD